MATLAQPGQLGDSSYVRLWTSEAAAGWVASA